MGSKIVSALSSKNGEERKYLDAVVSSSLYLRLSICCLC